MKTKLMMIAVMRAACFTMVSCGNAKKQQAQSAEQVTTAALSIDDVMAKAADLVDQTVTIEGVCTHTCSHGAKKMFLVGSDDSKTLRIEAGELGAFDTKVVNNNVTVKGILKEERIDEAYLVKLLILQKAVSLISVLRLLLKRLQQARSICRSTM